MTFRTDLAIEAHESINISRGMEAARPKLPEGVTVETEQHEHANITVIRVESEEAQKALGKRQGLYVTVEVNCDDITTFATQRSVSEEIAKQLRVFTETFSENGGPVLVIGLGNRYITPDSLGTCTAEKVLATHHIKSHPEAVQCEFFEKAGDVCTFSAGVIGVTGIESAEVIKGIAEQIKPCAILVIDALAARKTTRINGAIQITDTGIVPGSGVGNRRFEISKETMNVPVISVGVPTVVDAATLVGDVVSGPEESREEQFEALLARIEKVVGENMIVTPKNIDAAIERMARVLADAINMTLHSRVSVSEINEFFL